MRKVGFLIPILFFALSYAPLFANPQIEVTLSSKKIKLTETAELKIQIQWPKAEAHYSFAIREPKLFHLTLEQQGESQEHFVQNGEEWVQKNFILTLKPTQPGRALIESFIIPYIDANTQKGGEFNVSEQTLEVMKPFPVFGGVILILLVAIAVAGTVFFIVHRRSIQAKMESAEGLSGEALIIQKIKKLQAERYQKPQKETLQNLTGEFREFLREHYRLNTNLKASDQDLVSILESQNIPRHEVNEIKRLMDNFYEAKFTGTELGETEWNRLFRDLIQWAEGKQVVGNPNS